MRAHGTVRVDKRRYGLKAVTRCLFRYRIITKRGVGDWSQVVGKRFDDVEPLTETRCKRNDDVEPLTEARCKRNDDVEPRAKTRSRRNDDVDLVQRHAARGTT